MKKKIFDCEKVKELYAQGKSIAVIAIEVDAPKNSINKYLKEQGLIREKGHVAKKKEEEKLKRENKLLDLKEKIKELHFQGLSSREIGKILSKSSKTICYHINKMNLDNSSILKAKKKEFNDKVLSLYREGKTIRQIAEILDSNHFTIGCIVKESGESRKWFCEEHSDLKLSYIQEQFILGSCLGDLNIQINKLATNARLCLVHCETQKELFMSKVNLLGEFMGSYKLSEGEVDKRTGKAYPGYRGNSLSHQEFTRLYNIIYPDGKKRITQEYIDMITHPIALAYWFMDDGSYNGILATNSFSIEEIELLIKLLNKFFITDISINKVQNNQYILRILSKSREKFDNLIKPYIIESMKYKLIYK